MGKKVLGVDPSTTVTGIAIIDGDKCLYTEDCVLKKLPTLEAKLLRIEDKITELIDAYQPDWVCIENQFMYKNAHTTEVLIRASTAAFMCAVRNNIPVSLISPSEIKKALVGNGQASKEQVKGFARQLFKLDKEISFDVADALAIASYGDRRFNSP